MDRKKLNSNLLESFILLSVAGLLATLSFFGANLILLPISFVAALLIFGYANAFSRGRRIYTAIIGMSTYIVSSIVVLLLPNIEAQKGTVQYMVIPMLYSFLACGIAQISNKTKRENVTKSMITDLVLCLFVSLLPYAFLLIKLYNGGYRGYFFITALAFVVVSFVYLVLSIVIFFTNNNQITYKVKVQLAAIFSLAIMIVLTVFLPELLPSLIIRANDIFFLIFEVILWQF